MRMCVWRTTSSPSVVNVISRCLPFDSTAFTVPPTTCRRAADGVTFGATSSNPVTTRPARARRSTVAVRKIVSPSGIPPSGARDAPEIAARGSREPGLAQRIRDWRLVHGSAVDGLDEERVPTLGPDLAGERSGERLARRLGVGFLANECKQLLFAAAEPSREAPIHKHDHGAGGAPRVSAPGALGPRPCPALCRRPAGRIALARTAERREESAHRMEAVVRDLACPHEIPQRVAELGRESATRSREELREERSTPRLKDLAEAVVDGPVRSGLRRRPQE